MYEYDAGFFDGEGSVSIYRTRRHLNLLVQITNNNREVLAFLQSSHGGRIHAVRKNHPRWKDGWHLVLQGDTASFKETRPKTFLSVSTLRHRKPPSSGIGN